jgi:2-keto-4-pentenoate hydratase/2-oxohepta-3-ene-1,7-dioic acid hydratase in catechol pathway
MPRPSRSSRATPSTSSSSRTVFVTARWLTGIAAATPFLRFGDRVRIEMQDSAGHSIFGAIEQTVAKYEKAGD